MGVLHPWETSPPCQAHCSRRPGGTWSTWPVTETASGGDPGKRGATASHRKPVAPHKSTAREGKLPRTPRNPRRQRVAPVSVASGCAPHRDHQRCRPPRALSQRAHESWCPPPPTHHIHGRVFCVLKTRSARPAPRPLQPAPPPPPPVQAATLSRPELGRLLGPPQPPAYPSGLRRTLKYQLSLSPASPSAYGSASGSGALTRGLPRSSSSGWAAPSGSRTDAASWAEGGAPPCSGAPLRSCRLTAPRPWGAVLPGTPVPDPSREHLPFCPLRMMWGFVYGFYDVVPSIPTRWRVFIRQSIFVFFCNC